MDERNWHICDLHTELPAGCWRCDCVVDHSAGSLPVVAFAAQPLAQPLLPADVPLRTVLTALVAWAQRNDALLMMPSPSVHLAAFVGDEQLAHLDGFRLLGIDDAADRAIWDRALDRGMLLCGLLDRCRYPGRADAASLMMALRFGDYLACTGEPPLGWADDAHGARWQLRADGQARVIVRGGMEAAVIAGADGRWQDRGNEGWIRIELVDGAGSSYSQPRAVAPRAAL